METSSQINEINRISNPEVMKTPVFSLSHEEEHELVSLMLRARDNTWGDANSDIGKKINNYFKLNQLPNEVKNFLEKYRNGNKNDLDAETIYNLALGLDNHTRNRNVFDMLAKYKNVEKAEEAQQQLSDAIQSIKSILPSELIEDMEAHAKNDTDKRESLLPKYKKNLNSLISFFRPSPSTSPVKTITLMNSDLILSKKSGAAFSLGEELVISSHVDNPDNINHEFLHSVINPIVEKISSKLSNEQKQKIIDMASRDLKYGQEYGEDHFSLLCEELIRTYNDIYRKNEAPISYEKFIGEADKLDEKKFDKILQEKESFAEKCEQLNVRTFEEFKAKRQEYFDAYHKNELRDRIFEMYKEYDDARTNDPSLNFENYIRNNYDELI